MEAEDWEVWLEKSTLGFEFVTLNALQGRQEAYTCLYQVKQVNYCENWGMSKIVVLSLIWAAKYLMSFYECIHLIKSLLF